MLQVNIAAHVQFELYLFIYFSLFYTSKWF